MVLGLLYILYKKCVTTQVRILRLQTVFSALDRVLPKIDANVKMS